MGLLLNLVLGWDILVDRFLDSDIFVSDNWINVVVLPFFSVVFGGAGPCHREEIVRRMKEVMCFLERSRACGGRTF